MSHQSEALVLIEVGACSDHLYPNAATAMRHNVRCIKYAHINAYNSIVRRVKQECGLDMDSPQISLSHSVSFSDTMPDEAQQVHRNWLVTIQAHIRCTKPA